MRFSDFFMLFIAGRRGRGSTPWERLSALEQMSRLSTRDPVVFEPPGRKNKMVLLDDLDERGRLRADYMERRARRKREAEGEPSPIGGGFDVYPDD